MQNIFVPIDVRCKLAFFPAFYYDYLNKLQLIMCFFSIIIF